MGCTECAAGLEQAQRDLRDMTTERDQLAAILNAVMHVMTAEQFAEVRSRVEKRDSAV